MTGRSISNFEIGEKLGSGGMGVVYRARDIRLNRPCALKFLPSHLATDEDAKARFIQEAQAASALDHANICSIYQIGETDEGELFIAMAHYEGQTLKYRLKEEDFPVDRATNIAVQLARGLLRAHEAGIVHRDVKPANIMVTDRGEVKLLDFGLAKLATGAQLTKSGSTLGTAAYMSPEQYRGEDVGPAADVWGLGVVLYEMLTGDTPFAGDYEQALMYSVLNTEAQPIRERNPSVPAGLADFVMRCLEKEPRQRPDLQELVALEGSAARPATATRPDREATSTGSRSIPAGRKLAVVAGVVVGILAIALLWYVRFAPGSEEPSLQVAGDSAVRVAVLPFTVRGGADIEYLGQGMVDILSTKLDGAGNWRTVDPRAVLATIGDSRSAVDPAAGREAARKLDADHFILGSIVQAGNRLQVRASVYGTALTGDPTAIGSVEGEADDLFGLIDEMAAQLLVGGEQNPGERVKRIAAVTTESLPALKSYLEGEAHFRRGDYRAALDAFQQATLLDSTFALAWYRVSVAAEWNAQGRTASRASQQALRYSSRLAPHDRDLLETLASFRKGEAARSEQMYRTIVALYPEDVEAWFQLGEVLFHHTPLVGESISGSREAWERVLSFEPDHLQALWHLSRISAVENNVAEMDSLVERIVELNPGGERLAEVLALQAGVHDDEAMKRDVVRRMETASEAAAALAAQFTAVYVDDPEWAIRLMQILQRDLHSIEHRMVGYLWEGFIEAARGRLAAADSLVAVAVQLSPGDALPYHAFLDLLPFAPSDESSLRRTIALLESWDTSEVRATANPQSWHTVHDGFRENLRLYLLGMLSLQLDDAAAAARFARELSGLRAPESLGTVAEDISLSLRAEIEMTEGRWKEGLELLSEQRGAVWYNLLINSPFVSLSRDRFVKARLLQKAGRLDEALRLFNSFGENGVYDLVFEAPSHFHRAEIYESIGDPSAAIDHYRRVVDLWAEADPKLQPIVEHARDRLTSLGAE